MNYKSWLGGGCRFYVLGLLVTLGAIAVPPVIAQTSNILPDSTLGNSNSVVIPNANGLPVELVVGGDQRGGNLFQSFSEFNVSAGRAAYFNQPQGVINILTRVTGTNPSQILGTLGVLGSANLFFINPNGIVFGPNASLDVGGAFVASTANAIRLGDSGLFSASNPASSNLLSIQPSALFFNALQPKPIINQSVATSNVLGISLNGDPDRTISGLQVLNGQPLLLVGGPISMPGGILTAFDGRVELAAISGQGNVGLIGQGQSLRLSLPADLARADISFSQKASANVRGSGAGSIAVYANNLSFTQGSGLAAGIDLNGSPVSGMGEIQVSATNNLTLEGGSGIITSVSDQTKSLSLLETKAASVFIDAGTIKVADSIIGSFTDSQGNAGDVTVQAKNAILLDSGIILSSVTASGMGNGGNVFLKGGSLTVQNGRGITALTLGQGNAGSIRAEIAGDIVVKNGSQISATTSNRGDAGSITLLAGGNVSLDGSSYIANAILDSATGNGKDLTINARSLSVTNNSGVIASTIGQGNAGNIKIDVSDGISLTGGSQIQSFSGSNGNPGNIELNAGGAILFDSAGTGLATGIGNLINKDGIGKGQAISIKAKSLTLIGENAIVSGATLGQGNASSIKIDVVDSISLLNGGQIQSLSLGKGDPGKIELNAGGAILLDSTDTDQVTGIANAIDASGIGEGQDISITANSLTVRGSNAFVGASTIGQGNAGNVKVDVLDGISLLNGGQIQSFTSGIGNAGRIELNAGGNILLTGTGTFGTAGVRNTISSSGIGEGNDITIKAQSLTITDAAGVNASNNGQGGAGNISIDVAEDVSLLRGGEILSSTQGVGNAGSIAINAGGQIQINGLAADGSLSGISTQIGSTGVGNGSGISLQAQSLNIGSGGLISTSTAGSGNAGNINVFTQNAINLSGGSSIDSSTSGIGNGGIINLTTRSLSLTGGSEILAVVARDQSGAGGQGRGGTINVNADSVNISGFSGTSIPSGLFALSQTGTSGAAGDISINTSTFDISNAGVVAAGTNNAAPGGNITINANQFTALDGGQIVTSTQGSGNAGTILLNVTGNATLAGQEANFQQRIAQQQTQNGTQQQLDLGASDRQGFSGLFAGTSPNSTGIGGSILVNADQLTLRDGATMTVDSRGTGNGGNLNIQVGNLLLENGASLNAATASGEGGNIALRVANLLQMRQNSLISAQAQGTGNGGNIGLNTRFLVASGNSDIIANAFAGRGGNIQITAQGIFGIQPRDTLTSESDINASSQFGADGVVQLNTSVDPSTGLELLPFIVVDVSGLIAQGCRAENSTASRFVVTGRGGLPSNPSDLITNEPVLDDLGQPVASQPMATSNPSPMPSQPEQKSHPEPPQPIVEAQGWVVRPDGKTVLTTQSAETQPTWFATRPCQAH